jgi:sodium transport system permease protein
MNNSAKSSSAIRWDFVFRVLYKELLSTIRDRRTLISSIVMPLVLIPVIFIGLPTLLGRTFSGEQEKRQVVGIVGLSNMPEALVTVLQRDRPGVTGIQLQAVDDATAAVQAGTVEAALVVSKRLPEEAGGIPVELEIHSKQSSQKAQLVVGKIQASIEVYAKTLVAKKLLEAGLPVTTLTPIIPKPVNADTPAEQASGVLAFLIPLFLMQWIVLGGQATAIDATAGEKERGTLEALLVTPIQRLEVVVGKLLAVATFSVGTTLVSLTSLLLTGVLSRWLMPILNSNQADGGQSMSRIFGANLLLGPEGVVLLVAVGLSMAVCAAALLVAVCIFARSFKEAQTYLVPIALMMTLPSVFLQLADFLTRSLVIYAIPVIGSMVTMLDIVKGEVNWASGGLVIAVNLACAVLLLFFALHSFRREQVLFRN